MSKHKIGKLELDNVVCLMEDGSCKLVHVSDIVTFFNRNCVDFALIPLQDGNQYVACNMIPKKFRSFSIEFDMNLIAPEGVDWLDVEDVIYENVRHYSVQCDNFVDFIRFIQSTWLMCTVVEGFDVGIDNPMSAYEFDFSNVSYTYITKKNVHRDRLKTEDGIIPSSFTFMKFINAVSQVVFGLDNILSVIGCDKIIIIDSKTNTWDISEYPKSVSELSMYDHKRYLILPFDSTTLSAPTVSYVDLLMINKSMSMMSVQFAAVVDIHSFKGSLLDGPGKTLNEVLLDLHGDGYERPISMKSFSNSDTADLFDTFYIAHASNFNTSSSVLSALHDYKRLLRIIDIITQIIVGQDQIILMQICSEIRGFNNENQTLYHYICGDLDALSSDDDLYESYMNELHMLFMNELPMRYIHRDPELLFEMPYELPF